MTVTDWLLGAVFVLFWVDAYYTRKWLHSTREQLKVSLKLLEEMQHDALNSRPAPPSRA